MTDDGVAERGGGADPPGMERGRRGGVGGRESPPAGSRPQGGPATTIPLRAKLPEQSRGPGTVHAAPESSESVQSNRRFQVYCTEIIYTH